MKYPNYLQHYRRRAQLNQFEFAKRLGKGVNRVAVSSWEVGNSLPTPEQVHKITAILGVTENELFPPVDK